MTVQASSENSPRAREPQRVRVGDLDIAYDVRGKGAPLLMLTGVSMRRIFWPEEICDLLAEMGFRVIRMDNRDAGDSSRVEARPPNVLKILQRSLLGLPFEVPYRLEDMAGDAFGLMSALGFEKFHVAGASMGGMIAQTMAITNSDRLSSLTSVMSSPGGRRYSIGKLSAMRALLKPLPKERAAQVDQLMDTFRLLAGNVLPFDDERIRELVEAQVDGGSSPASSARQLGAIFESSGRRLGLLQKITTPTLVIHGSEDPLLPLRGGIATARKIRNAELLVVRGMGHTFPSSAMPLVAGAIATHARKATHRRAS